MNLDLDAPYLRIVRSILKQEIPDREVWAFGSRVTGKPKKFSDLDLAIIGDHLLDFDTLGRLRHAFSESDLPYRVDVVDFATARENFRKIIQAAYVIVQAGKRPRPGQT